MVRTMWSLTHYLINQAWLIQQLCRQVYWIGFKLHRLLHQEICGKHWLSIHRQLMGCLNGSISLYTVALMLYSTALIQLASFIAIV